MNNSRNNRNNHGSLKLFSGVRQVREGRENGERQQEMNDQKQNRFSSAIGSDDVRNIQGSARKRSAGNSTLSFEVSFRSLTTGSRPLNRLAVSTPRSALALLDRFYPKEQALVV
jgi:hypothetical protein